MSHVRKPSDYVLNKKMPNNPRYKNVKPVVDTGSSLRRHLDMMEELRRNFKYRKDELFKRIKLPMLVNLMVEVAKMNTPVNEDVPSSATLIRESVETKIETKRPQTPMSRFQSLIGGVGEMDIIGDQPNSSPDLGIYRADQDDPYLLLDVREPEEYSQCHIITAENYPTSMLARTMDFESKSLLAFKNKDKKIIVMYDEDETRAPRVATTLVQRGYDNIYMLSGGLKLAFEKFPKGLMSGCPPWIAIKSKSSVIKEEKRNEFTNDDLKNLEKYLISFGPTVGCNSAASSVLTSGKSSMISPRGSRSQPTTASVKSKPWK